MLRVSKGAVAALVVLACALSGCGRTPASETAGETKAAEAPPPDAPPAPEPPPPPKPVPTTLPDVIARVNDETITRSEVEQRIKQMEVEAGRAVPEDRRDEIYRGVIDQLVTYAVLTQETRARNVVVSEAEARKIADARIAELRKQVPSEAEFNKALAERGMTVARLRADIRRDIAIGRMLEQELAQLPPLTESEMKDYFEKNPDEFRGVRASHVLIRPDGFDEASRKKARAAIEDVLTQARAGTDFGELARKHSADGSAQAGGDLGFFTKQQMVPEFSNAAFSLQPGQISDIVETQYGFHIIKVTERREVQFSEATEKLRDYLTERRRQEAEEAFVKALKDRARIEVLI